jgi:hypothetical protein
MAFLSQLAMRLHQIGAAEASALPLPPAKLWTDCMGTAEKPLILLHILLWAPWLEAIIGCDPEPWRNQEKEAGGELRKELRDDKPTWREDTQEKRREKCMVDFSLLKKKRKLKKKTQQQQQPATPNMFAKTASALIIFSVYN